MPRANRHYIPGYIWHLTHRCHKKEFLLKFARDRLTQEALGDRGVGRVVMGSDGSYELQESQSAYRDIFGHENEVWGHNGGLRYFCYVLSVPHSPELNLRPERRAQG